VQSPSQARRLADRASQRLNAKMTGGFRTRRTGLKAIGERWVRLQYPYLSGLQDCVVEIQDGTEIDLLGGWCRFNFLRIAPDTIEAYDPAPMKAPPPVPPPPPPGGPFFIGLLVRTNSQYLPLIEDI
jgi:hypothetical protein